MYNSLLNLVTPQNVELVGSIVGDVKQSPVLVSLINKFRRAYSEEEIYDILLTLTDAELEELSRVIARGFFRARRKVFV